MITVKYGGRLGNVLVQYAAAYILSKNTGCVLKAPTRSTTYHAKADYNMDFTSMINIPEVETPNEKQFENTIVLTDKRLVRPGWVGVDYFDYLNKEPASNYQCWGFFQDGRLLCDYRKDILELFNCDVGSKHEPDPDDVFIHARFGDTLRLRRAYCDTRYVQQQLEENRNKYRKIYLTSDSIDYPPVIDLIKKYNITPYENDPVETILFGKKFNNLVLSAGSFSYWIGYLSNAKNICVYGYGQDARGLDVQLKRRMNRDKKVVTVNCALQNHNAWSYNKNVKFTM